jgi:hypothetical protein
MPEERIQDLLGKVLKSCDQYFVPLAGPKRYFVFPDRVWIVLERMTWT